MKKIKLFYIFMVLIMLFSSIAHAYPVQAAPTASAWCGKMSSYTTSYWSDVEKIWKPILYVWKGNGKGNPYAVSMYFDGKYVPDADNAIRVGSPQVDNNDGWVGYFIAKRWYLTHPKWDDDARWEVRGCIP